jgi:hypothetical protein
MADHLTKEKVRSYILGEFSETEQLALEEELFSSDENFQMLADLKAQLIDDYAFHKLSDQERKRFEKQFLNSPWRRQRVTFALALNDYIASHNFK